MTSSITAQDARALGCRSAGEVAELLGITNRTLHFYEEEGLIHPLRTDGGTRFYDDTQVRRAEACATFVRLGFPVKVVQELVDAASSAATGEQLARTVGGVLAELRARVAVQIDEMNRFDDELAATQRMLRSCSECDRPIADCPDCLTDDGGAPLLVPLLQGTGA